MSCSTQVKIRQAHQQRGHMKTRVKTYKMAELEAETDEQETYSFTECQKIGKDFLDELKQSLVRENMEKEEPRVNATKYLEETAILHLLEVSLLWCKARNFTHAATGRK